MSDVPEQRARRASADRIGSDTAPGALAAAARGQRGDRAAAVAVLAEGNPHASLAPAILAAQGWDGSEDTEPPGHTTSWQAGY